ncbi:glucosamine-6-phosphate deaminase [Chryseolinea sp. H1M3-3]|uniref:glucosamine-6-phosphate deaminase n=1 Tax=Chryseolinea sp. H1M3-3 TaxID=3034144 RepID=UPI0023EC6C63|nr:glucosamine-6-phosphate deaminase [Chryseolinea sp. H1M3-3]
MNIQIKEDAKALGKKAGADAAQAIRAAIASTGKANIILATGTSQFETLKQLIAEDIDWSKVVMFHLDEYIDLPVTHPASFRKYLQEKFIANVSPLKAVNLVNGEADPEEECSRLGKLISAHPIDVALVGIGENGHLAFNDPPADFTTERPYIIVNLDEPCRRQQLGEGWFKSLDEVPPRAISMSVKQIMKSKIIICSVPDSRKALAVKNSVEQKISNLYPASILQSHADCRLYLDKNSAAQLSKSSSYIA